MTQEIPYSDLVEKIRDMMQEIIVLQKCFIKRSDELELDDSSFSGEDADMLLQYYRSSVSLCAVIELVHGLSSREDFRNSCLATKRNIKYLETVLFEYITGEKKLGWD